LTKDVAKTSLILFDRARRTADDDQVRARLEKASICAHKAFLSTHTQLRYENGVAQLDIPRGYEGIVDRYLELCKKYEMTNVSETRPAEQYFERIEKRARGVPALQIRNDHWKLAVVPEENGNMVELVPASLGRNLVAYPNLNSDREHSLEEFGMAGYDHKATSKFEGKVEENSIVLTKTLDDGSEIQRIIRLGEGDDDKVHFESSITHKGSEPKAFQLRVHPEYDAASSSKDGSVVSGYAKNGEWRWINQEWDFDHPPEEDFLRESKGGGIAFFNHQARYGIRQTFDPEAFEYPYFWWGPRKFQVNLELVTKKQTLQPGEIFKFGYAVEFLSEAPEG